MIVESLDYTFWLQPGKCETQASTYVHMYVRSTHAGKAGIQYDQDKVLTATIQNIDSYNTPGHCGASVSEYMCSYVRA